MEVLSELGPLFYMWNASGWAFFFFSKIFMKLLIVRLIEGLTEEE